MCRIRFQIKTNCISLAVLGLSSIANISLAAEIPVAPYDHAVQAAESCASCHEKNQVDVFKSGMASDCNQCHSSGDEQLLTVVDKKFSGVYADKLNVAPPPQVTAGMSVPMRYNETRIGKEPNQMVLIPAGKYLRGSITVCRTKGRNMKWMSRRF